MRTLDETSGVKVMSKGSAEQVGKVQRVVLDVPARRIAALQIGRDELVDWSAVTGVGTDAVVIESHEEVRPPLGEHEQRAVRGDFDLHGKRVLSDAGNEMGLVRDVEFDETSGSLLAFTTSEGSIEADRLVGLGSYCVVVRRRPEAELPG